MYIRICTLTVQDIIISNPLKSAGVIELEVVMLYSDGGSVKKYILLLRTYICTQICMYTRQMLKASWG